MITIDANADGVTITLDDKTPVYKGNPEQNTGEWLCDPKLIPHVIERMTYYAYIMQTTNLPSLAS